MKKLLDPAEVRALRDRGTVRTPAGLSTFLDGRRGMHSLDDSYPYPRYWLWLEMWCARLAGEPHPYDFFEIQVGTFYQGVLPWLAYGFGDEPATRRAIDLVDLTDELMLKEGAWYGSSVAWPLTDVLRVFADVFTTFYLEPVRDLVVAWDLHTQAWLPGCFFEVIRAIEEHEDCCPEIRVNVHWW